MNEQGFVERRDLDWKRLSALCDSAESGIKRMSASDLREFIRLYRKVSTDLAVARTQSSNAPLISFLNDLVGRAYGILYRAPKASLAGALYRAVATAAQTVRRHRRFVLASAIIFFGSAFLVYNLMNWFPDTRSVLIPDSQDKLFETWKSGKFEDHSGSQSGMMTGFYASNNPRTSIITGAVGAGSFGIISVYLLFQNGAMLGALAHEMAGVGKLFFLLSSVAPHGVPELSGIVVAGATGLLLGATVIAPGRRRRSDALKAVGKDAVVLLSTSVVLMFIAAPIEGFFSFQSSVPQWLKVVVALIGVCFWTAFWTFFGREEQPAGA